MIDAASVDTIWDVQEHIPEWRVIEIEGTPIREIGIAEFRDDREVSGTLSGFRIVRMGEH